MCRPACSRIATCGARSRRRAGLLEDDETERASQIMADRQIRRLPVLSQEEKLVGIIALADLATRVSEAHASSEVLEHVSSPTKITG